MENSYTIERLEEELDIGYLLYFTYVRNRYELYKTSENSYTLKLLTDDPKNPLPRTSIITKKRLYEMFPHMESIEYKAIN